MTNKSKQNYFESEVNRLSQRIIDKGPADDEVSYIQLGFHLALRRIIRGNPQPSDLGLLGTIEDTFKALNIIPRSHDIISYLNESESCQPDSAQ